MKVIVKIILIVFLTITTQVGGVIFLLSELLIEKFNVKFRFQSLVCFIVMYSVATFLIIPTIAPIFGREAIKNSDDIKPTNYMTVLLNRNYVRPELNRLLSKTESKLKGEGIKINYLDANFPFINKFPLLPHLSHNDGKKIDLSLIYETNEGEISESKKSISGYGVFEQPVSEEVNQIENCLKKGYFQYDYPKYLTFGSINKDLIFSESGTKKLIRALLNNNDLGKIFIEPHLKQRLKLTNKRIRYHGCKAVRHDDHIHIQLK